MIVLDTNVLSELLKPAPSGSVLRWLSMQPPRQIFTTTITQAEIFYGVESLPPRKRRKMLAESIEALFAVDFQARILTFDEQAARKFAEVVTKRERIGRPISQFDAMIASICLTHGATVATRDSEGFGNCELRVINPWRQ